MGDFDAVLERLMMDAPFRAALAADPDRALAGYRLTPDEVGLLRSQVSDQTGGERAVETRTSKSSLFGMFGSIAGTGHGTALPGMSPPRPDDAAAPIGQWGTASGHGGSSVAGYGSGPTAGYGSGPTAGYGSGPTAGHGSLEAAQGQTSLGSVTGPGTAGQAGFGPGAAGQAAFGPGGAGQAAFGPGGAGAGHGGLHAAGDHTPAGYHPHIDADGDGKWDQYTAVQHADGSVDIYADRNHDGNVDFIGHDRNHDGLVESADYDKNFNGTFETHMRDVNGDGWLDTRVVHPDPPLPPAPPVPGPPLSPDEVMGQQMPASWEELGTDGR
jgi:hypothetical protein